MQKLSNKEIFNSSLSQAGRQFLDSNKHFMIETNQGFLNLSFSLHCLTAFLIQILGFHHKCPLSTLNPNQPSIPISALAQQIISVLLGVMFRIYTCWITYSLINRRHRSITKFAPYLKLYGLTGNKLDSFLEGKIVPASLE